MLAFDTFFPSHEIVGTPENTRVLEGEIPHPQTGLPIRMYDTRTFDRVAQLLHAPAPGRSGRSLAVIDADFRVVRRHGVFL